MSEQNRHYRKKPVVIEAFQMTRERRTDNSEWPEWLNQAWNESHDTPGAVFPHDYPNSDGTDLLCIFTLEGLHLVGWDDWIIRGVKGELYPCKPEIFTATYEIAQHEPAVCKRCGGTRLVDDGEITGVGGVEFENGPVKCVKDCPVCARAETLAQGAVPAMDAAAFIERKADDYANQFGYGVGGTLTFDSQAKMDYYTSLTELAEEIRALVAPQQSGTLPYPTELTDSLFDVLSLMLWHTGPIAHVLRAGGAEIKKRAEDEQAHVLHWLIQLAIQHGPAWRERASDSIKEIRAASRKTDEVPA